MKADEDARREAPVFLSGCRFGGFAVLARDYRDSGLLPDSFGGGVSKLIDFVDLMWRRELVGALTEQQRELADILADQDCLIVTEEMAARAELIRFNSACELAESSLAELETLVPEIARGVANDAEVDAAMQNAATAIRNLCTMVNSMVKEGKSDVGQ